jgi:hypothetical protein
LGGIKFMLERLGKVCGWVGTGLALIIAGLMTCHVGDGRPDVTRVTYKFSFSGMSEY